MRLRSLFVVPLLCMAAWRLEMEREQMHPGVHVSIGSMLTQAKIRLPDVHAAGGADEIYFSPSTNLQEIDVSLIDHAQKRIQIAMYAFTDRTIAQALAQAASRGVEVSIYRDRAQFQEEQGRRGQVLAVLSRQPNIHLRVKGGDDLMHEKAMLIDNEVLRDGSGNWSLSAARYQDNQVSLTHNSQQIEAFERDFTAMWDRTDNLRVQ